MQSLVDRIRRMIGSDLATPVHADIIAASVVRRLMSDAQDLPYQVGALVRTSEGERYLVAGIAYVNCGSQPASYTLRGHPTLGTTPGTHAWSAHADLELLELPTAHSWALLKDAFDLDHQSRVVTLVPARG